MKKERKQYRRILNLHYFALIFLLFLMQIVPSQLLAWGGYVHRLINKFAVDNLPQNMIDDNSKNAFGDW
jgi:hypothetical protein